MRSKSNLLDELNERFDSIENLLLDNLEQSRRGKQQMQTRNVPTAPIHAPLPDAPTFRPSESAGSRNKSQIEVLEIKTLEGASSHDFTYISQMLSKAIGDSEILGIFRESAFHYEIVVRHWK